MFFRGKHFILILLDDAVWVNEVGNHVLDNEAPQTEYSYAAVHIWWYLSTAMAFLNVYVKFYWVHVLWS